MFYLEDECHTIQAKIAIEISVPGGMKSASFLSILCPLQPDAGGTTRQTNVYAGLKLLLADGSPALKIGKTNTGYIWARGQISIKFAQPLAMDSSASLLGCTS